jgi:hypothetical protein
MSTFIISSPPVTADQIPHLVTELQNSDNTVKEGPDNTYSIIGQGFDVTAVYDPVGLRLTVTINKKPHFWIPDSAIESAIRASLAKQI